MRHCLLLLLLSSAACSSSAQTSVKTQDDADEEGPRDFERPLTPDEDLADDEDSDADEVVPAAQSALLGARQDLSFKGPTNPTCKCLAVVVGQSTNSAFGWESLRPRTDPETQLVLALTEAPCPELNEGSPVSYRGYRVDGNDVVVQIEPAVPGRPKTAGAIIPKPAADGIVYLEGDTKMARGKGLDGAKRCKLGNPGGARTDPAEAFGTKRLGTPKAPPK